MQIILSDEEITVIHEALLTEEKDTREELKKSERKGRGEFDRLWLEKIKNVQKRFDNYVK